MGHLHVGMGPLIRKVDIIIHLPHHDITNTIDIMKIIDTKGPDFIAHRTPGGATGAAGTVGTVALGIPSAPTHAGRR